MSRRAVLSWVVILVVVGATLAWLRSPPQPLGGPAGWTVTAGDLTRLDLGHWRAAVVTRLERGGLELRVAAGAELRFTEAGELAELMTGAATLTATEEFELREWNFTPLAGEDGEVGPSGRGGAVSARLEITPLGFELTEGWLRAQGRALLDGRVLSPESPFFRFDRGIPLTDGPGPAVPDDRGAPALGAPTGQIVDAADGRPVSDAWVHLVFSPHEEGYPPYADPAARVTVAGAADGTFTAPVFRASDPRVFLHVEVDHPDFEPYVQVLGPGADVAGRWPFFTVRLRRAVTTVVRLVDPEGQGVPQLAVELDGSPADRFAGEDAWDEGRTLRPDRALIRYTQADGSLRLTQDAQRLTVRDPVRYLWDADVAEPTRYVLIHARAELARGVSPEKWAILPTRDASGLPDTLIDGEGVPVADALVEIEVEGMRPVRLLTDALGRYLFVPRPYPGRLLDAAVLWPQPWPVRFDRPCGEEDELCDLNPRRGRLTVLSPTLWKQEVEGTFDRQARDRYLEARPAGLLRLSLQAVDAEGVPRPVPADSVTIDDPGLTLVERSLGGDVVFAGALPTTPGQRLLAVNRYEPVLLQIPARLARDRYLDLGPIALELGDALPVRLQGGSAELYERATFRIAPARTPQLAQRLRFDGSGEQRVTGLRRGVEYVFGVDGSGFEPYAGELLLDTESANRGLDILLSLRDEALVSASGMLADLTPQQTPGYRVIERYYGRDGRVVSCVSYPLRPDAGFGSVRRLREREQAEVFVLGPYFRVATALRNPVGPLEFEFGVLDEHPSRYAILSFCGRSATHVLSNLSIVSDTHDYHDVVRRFAVERSLVESYLVIDNLMPGRYRLDWSDPDGSPASYLFEVDPRDEVLRLEVPCPDPSLLQVVVAVADPSGTPIVDATFEGVLEWAPLPLTPFGALPDGVDADLFPSIPRGVGAVYVLTIEQGKPLDIRITAAGFLGQRWRVPVGRSLPAEVRLERGVRVEGTVQDPNSLPFTGRVSVRWTRTLAGEPEEPPILVTHVDPQPVVSVANGVVEDNRLPTGPHTFEFADSRSEARAIFEQDFRGHRPGELQITLRESRALRGTVVHRDGTPVGDAVVALVASGEAYRFPQFEPPLASARYSTQVDAKGGFVIDGVPVDLRGDLALLAHAPGWTDGVEDPFDPALGERVLVIDDPTELILDIGYAADEVHDDYEFVLEHSFDRSGRSPLVRIGPLLPTQLGGRAYVGVTPGYYRVTWSHVNAPAGAVGLQRRVDAVVAPGRSTTLQLRVREPFRPGDVQFNGEPLAAGWVLLTNDPGDPQATRVARVTGGQFTGPIPTGGRLYAAVVPDDRAQPFPDQRRGEALFREIRGGRGSRAISVDYSAHDLELVFPPGSLARYPNLTVELLNYEWVAQGYRTTFVPERVTSNPLVLRLLARGTHRFKVSTSEATRIVHEVEVVEDERIEVGL
ncbi:MAG: hypothetical protein AB7O52_05385 [Planctomycetota bacterium]